MKKERETHTRKITEYTKKNNRTHTQEKYQNKKLTKTRQTDKRTISKELSVVVKINRQIGKTTQVKIH